jgi:hypothetical protein
MKLNGKILMLLLGAAVIAASCKKEDPKPAVQEEYSYTFGVSAENMAKALAAGDKVGVYIPAQDKTVQAEVAVKDPVKSITLKLSEELAKTDEVCAFYPASAQVSKGVASLEIPAAQTGADFSAMPCVAAPAASGAGIKLLALGSAIDFSIVSEKAESEVLKSVSFESETPLAGKFSIDLQVVDASLETTFAIRGIDGKSAKVELAEGITLGATAADVYMIVAPGSYKGTVTLTTDKGSYEFPVEEAVKAERNAAAKLEFKLSDPVTSVALDTEVLYNVLDKDGNILKERTCVVSKDDFDNGRNHAATFTDGTIKDYFALVDDPNVFLLYGYVEKSKYEYGYTSIAARILGQDDAEHAGCKVVEILSSCISADLEWEGYTQTPGKGWYNPEDGSVTIENCTGHLGWGYDFNWNRTYMPATDIALSTNTVSMQVGQSKNVTVEYSNGDCTVAPADASIATASYKDKVITINGIAEGSTTVAVSDTKGKKAEIAVTVKPVKEGIATDVTYSITFFSDDTHHSTSYTPTCEENEVKGVYICTREEYEAKTAASVFYNGTDPWVLKNYFDKYTDDSIMAIGGYVDSKKVANYFYLAITMQLTSEEVTEGEFAGCKKIDILHSVPCASEASGLSWYKSNGYESQTGTGYYNPKDGSITIVDLKGKKGGKEFNVHRRYSPEN